MKKRLTAMDYVSMIVVGIFALICVMPFVYVFCVSFMPYSDYSENPLNIIPSNIDLTAYKQMLGYDLIRSGYLVTVFITIAGTALSIFLLVISAYPLSKKDLKGHRFFMGMVLFTMFFNGGMISNYILIRGIKLQNTVWSLIIPGCISAFSLILMKNFILQSIPDALEEAARIDGCSDFGIFMKVILPVIKPAMASWGAITLIARWNDFFWPLLYLRKQVKYTLMVTISLLPVSEGLSTPWPVILAGTTLVIIPIIVLYLILERFQKAGMMEGAVKG